MSSRRLHLLIYIVFISSILFCANDDCFPTAKNTFIQLDAEVTGSAGSEQVEVSAFLYEFESIELSAQNFPSSILLGPKEAFNTPATYGLQSAKKNAAVGVDGGLIIVKWGAYSGISNDATDGVCRMVTGTDGKNKATLPFPPANSSYTYTSNFCPYTANNNDPSEPQMQWMANCAKLKLASGEAIELLDWEDIEVCPDSADNDVFVELDSSGEEKDCGTKYLPSTNYITVKNDAYSPQVTTFCWLLALIFGLMFAAQFSMGRNPLNFFNIGSMRGVRMNRNAGYYTPIHQNVNLHTGAMFSALGRGASLASEAGSDNEEGKKAEAEAEADVASAEADLADAKASGDDTKIANAEANLGAAKSNLNAVKDANTFDGRMQRAGQTNMISNALGKWTNQALGKLKPFDTSNEKGGSKVWKSAVNNLVTGGVKGIAMGGLSVATGGSLWKSMGTNLANQGMDTAMTSVMGLVSWGQEELEAWLSPDVSQNDNTQVNILQDKAANDVAKDQINKYCEGDSDCIKNHSAATLSNGEIVILMNDEKQMMLENNYMPVKRADGEIMLISRTDYNELESTKGVFELSTDLQDLINGDVTWAELESQKKVSGSAIGVKRTGLSAVLLIGDNKNKGVKRGDVAVISNAQYSQLNGSNSKNRISENDLNIIMSVSGNQSTKKVAEGSRFGTIFKNTVGIVTKQLGNYAIELADDLKLSGGGLEPYVRGKGGWGNALGTALTGEVAQTLKGAGENNPMQQWLMEMMRMQQMSMMR